MAAWRWKEWDCTCQLGGFSTSMGAREHDAIACWEISPIGWLDATMRLSSPPLNRPPPSPHLPQLLSPARHQLVHDAGRQ